MKVLKLGWSAETRTKRWPLKSALEMPVLSWFTIEEGIPKLREIRVLQWTSHIKPTHHTRKTQSIGLPLTLGEVDL